MRARIDVSEIEAQTKIRAKYLRALENEEWGLLPGSTFVKSFLRTYAQALGLDGKALVEEYRLHHEGPSEGALEPIVSTPHSSRGRTPPSGPSRGYVLAVGAIVAVIVLLIVLLVSGGGSPSSTTGTAKRTATHSSRTHRRASRSAAAANTGTTPVITLALRPSSGVYVCLIGDNARKLIPGIELQPGETTPTYHARRFQITLGNSSVTMFVDGHARTVPPSSQAIGYSITKARGRQPLSAGQLPTCR